MQSSLIVDAVVLAAVFEADLGRRKITKLRIARPLLIAAVIVPIFVKAVTTSGNGLTLEVTLAVAGVALGLAATAFMTVYRNPATNKPVSRAGFGYATVWAVVIGARAAFTYGSTHWFGPQLARWMATNHVTVDGITDALVFMAVTMLLTRTIWLAARAHHVTAGPAAATRRRQLQEVCG